MYKETQPACKLSSPDNRHEKNQPVISFFDDNKLMQSFKPTTTIPRALKSCTKSINFWRKSLEVTGGALDPNKCGLQLIPFNFNTYSYKKHYPNRGKPTLFLAVNQSVNCLLFDSEIDNYGVMRKLLGVRLAADRNCFDEFKARKAQSEKLAVGLSQSNALPVDAFKIYVFRYCPAEFYCIPIPYFTPAQYKQIQSLFMNAECFSPKISD